MSTALAMAKTTNMAKSEQPDHKTLCMRGFNYRETPEIIASQPGKQQSTLRFFSIKLRSGVECNAIRLGSSSWFSQDDRRKGWTGMEKDCTCVTRLEKGCSSARCAVGLVAGSTTRPFFPPDRSFLLVDEGTFLVKTSSLGHDKCPEVLASR